MNEYELRSRIGIFLIVSQFVLVTIVFISYLFGGYNFDEMTTTIALMFPMLSAYTTGIIKYFISNREQQLVSSNNVTNQFVFITYLVPVLFVFGLGFVILIKPFNGFGNFEQFKTVLAIIESIFGGFTGYIMSALLEE